jgi:amino acid adenylation domain-containing protein
MSANQETYGYPLSFAQRRLWFLDQLFPGTPLYNLPLVIHLTHPLDVDLLERCLAEMSRRHEALRTRFRTVSGEPVQVIDAQASVRLRVIPLDHLPADERENAAMAFATEDVRRPFDLLHGPLWRATLFRLDRHDHLLLITAHHIVSDGWSMGLMLQELEQLYTAFAAGRPSPLPELSVQYVDYAIWQHEALSSAASGADLAYWRNTLRDLSTLELPIDRPRPPVSTLRGRRHYFSLPSGIGRRVESLAQQEGATPFMMLLAAFALLLHRHTGDTDIAIGTPIAGRRRAEFEPLIGFFVNTLVIRLDLDGNPIFRELLRRVRERALEAYTHQDMPFEKLVEELQPTRDLSRNPLFQVMFALQNAPTGGRQRDGAVARSIEIETGLSGFDLALDVWPRGDEYGARMEFSVDLFDERTIRDLASRWVALVDALVSHPDRRVTDYQLSETVASEHLRTAATHSDEPIDRPATILERIERVIIEHAGAPAIVADHGTTSYATLGGRANALAQVLRAAGVRRDTPVAVLLDRSVEVAVALLAIWRAGGVYVPLDSRDPSTRLAIVLADVVPSVVLTTRAHAATIGDASPSPIIYIDEADGAPIEDSTIDDDRIGPTDLAYIMYTSGTTGQPRGVAVEHGALANHVSWMQSLFPLQPGDRVPQLTSLGFDVSIWELTAPLAAGATAVLPPPGAESEPARVVALVKQYDISALQTTPSFLRLMLDEDLASGRSLRWVFCGAESMPRELAKRFCDSGSTALLHNMYGPTEATIDASFYRCSSAGLPDTRSGNVPIGNAIANVRLYVLDAAGNRVPPGVAGELYISGANLARGYWRQPGLTAERFVQNPFEPAGARMYRTGDRVRVLPSGDLEVLGRVDRQVKVRGVRIEPGDIETALTAHPLVAEAFVAPAPSPRGDVHLVAYVAVNGSALGPSELRRFLENRVNPVMMPGAFVMTHALPRTTRGKIDVRALARLESAEQPIGHVYTAARNPTEATVIEIWQSLLAVPRIGVHDNFFELGGHSLLAAQVVSRVLDRLGREVSLRSFFEQPTVAGLAAVIDRVGQEHERVDHDRICAERSHLTPELVDSLSDHDVTQLLQAMLERNAPA